MLTIIINVLQRTLSFLRFLAIGNPENDQSIGFQTRSEGASDPMASVSNEFEDFDTPYLSDDNTPGQLKQMNVSDNFDSESVVDLDTQELNRLIQGFNNLDPESIINQDNKDIIISYDYLKAQEIEMLVQFARLFRMKIVHNNENATHLIVKTFNDNNFHRSKLTADALVKNIPIVTLKWVTECLIAKTLVPLDSFMPIDISDEPSPLSSWSFGQGYSNSKFEWTKRIILYFHRSVECHDVHSNIRFWAKKLGFVVADNLENFRNDDLDLRIILTERARLNDRLPLPSSIEVLDWARDYQALTIYVEWLTECIYQYKFIEITTKHMPVMIPKQLAYCSGLYGYYKIDNE